MGKLTIAANSHKAWQDRVWQLLLFIGLLIPTLAVVFAVQLLISMAATSNYDGGAAIGMGISLIFLPLMGTLPFIQILGIVSGFKLSALQRNVLARIFFKVWTWLSVLAFIVSILYWGVVIFSH